MPVSIPKFIKSIWDTQKESPIHELGHDSVDYESYNTDRLMESNYVLEFTRHEPDTLLLIAFTTAASIREGVSYEPSFPNAKGILDRSPFDSYSRCQSFINESREQTSDQEIMTKLMHSNHRTYDFIVFSLVTSRMTVRSLPTHNLCKYVFEVEHTVQKEDELSRNTKPTSFLFHGSPLHNWYSIMRQGLRVFSGTFRQANGAAYGSGIYLSDNASTSLYYCNNAKDDKRWKSMGHIVSVFELSGEAKDYQKVSSIFVVPKPELLTLRYILLWEDTPNSIALSRRFHVSCQKEKECKQQILHQVAQRRLMKELKQVTNLANEGFFVSEVDLSCWDVFMTFDGSQDEKSGTLIDLIKYGYDSVQLRLNFPSDYPIRPPSVRIIQPRFQRQTGHITSGGSICMEILTNQGWRSTCSVASLLVDIRYHILEGNGRLHPSQHKVQYSESEAKTSFSNVALAHGWV